MSSSLVCANPNCARGGQAASSPICPACGQHTRSAEEPGLVVPQPRQQAASTVDTLTKVGDVGSRVVYGGFWIIVAILAVIGGFALLSQGSAAGIAAFGIGGLAGLYARYIIKGGRWRIMFW